MPSISSAPPPPAARSIAEKMAKGAGWLIFLRFVVRGTGIVSTLILARLLIPADFGLISLAMTLAEGIEAMGAFGLQFALIRKPTIDRPLYDTAFTITFLRSLVVAAILVAVAPWSADFFADDRLHLILYVIAGITVLQGLENIGIVRFRKELQFEKEVLISLIPKLVAFFVTLTLAYLLRDYRALLVGIVSQRFTHIVLSYIMDSYRPRLSLAAWRELLKFSVWIWLIAITGFIKNKSDAYVLGRLLGPTSLGIFRIGHEIATLPTTEFVQPICRALFSGFAKAENTGLATRAILVQSTGLVLTITLPIGIGLSLCAEALVHVALGPNWIAAIPVIQILAAFSILTIIGDIGNMALIAVGRPGVASAMMIVGAGLRLPLIIAGTLLGTASSIGGLTGLAWAIAVSLVLEFAVNFVLIHRALHTPLVEFWRQIWRALLAAAIMTGAVLAALDCVPPADGFWPGLRVLGLATSTGAVVYIGAIVTLWRLAGGPVGPEALIIATLRQKFAAGHSSTEPSQP